MKNCGYRFHILVTARDFVEGVLVRSIIPRNNPPLVVHDRVLSIIQVRAIKPHVMFGKSSLLLYWVLELLLHYLCFSSFEAWADAFRSSPDLTGVVSVYEDLRRKGLEFPMTELNGYSTGQPPQKVQTWLLNSLLMLGCYLLPLVTSPSGRFCAFAHQTLPANGPAVTTLPSVLLSSKPPLIPSQTSELKLALEGTNALTPSQVMVWLFPC